MTRTCLVTGGAGFIGCAVSAGLADAFDRVIALDNLHPQIHAARRPPPPPPPPPPAPRSGVAAESPRQPFSPPPAWGSGSAAQTSPSEGSVPLTRKSLTFALVQALRPVAP